MSAPDGALAELRMNCCPTPEPTIERDSDDPKVWEIVCESCEETLAYILAPEDEDDPEGERCAGCDRLAGQGHNFGCPTLNQNKPRLVERGGR